MVGSLESALKSNLPKSDLPYVVGVSGGRDSMVLVDLLYRLGYSFILAHVNYGLRPEAIKETVLVQRWAAKRSLPLFVKFASNKLLKDPNHRGLQDAARHYRYVFFHDIVKKNNAKGIITAHHQDDQVETFLLKSIQGGGLMAVSGMHQHHNSVYKPLLDVTRSQISAYAKEYRVPFMDDSSNDRGVYVRNRLRNEVIPLLREIHPGAVEGLKRTIQNLGDHRQDIMERLDDFRASRLTTWQDLVILPWPESSEGILFKVYLLSNGFNKEQVEDILSSERASGRIFQTQRLSLTTYHSGLIIVGHSQRSEMTLYSKEEVSSAFYTNETMEVKTSDHWEGIFHPDLVAYPLVLRPWKEGDTFQPLGLGGRSKKVQDILTDRKIPALLKRRVLVLTDVRGMILWIPGIARSNYALVDGKRLGMKLRLKEGLLPFPEDLF